MLTTTDVREYRNIPMRLSRLRLQLKYLTFINAFVDADTVKDEIIRLQKRRRQLKRLGAY
jgi:hypothetical protein